MTAIPTKYQRGTALGLVLLAMRDSHMRNGMNHLDYWETLDGHVDIDWQEGPYASEVVETLMRLAADSDISDVLESHDISGVAYSSVDTAAPAQLVVCGVRVRLRPLNPIGHNKASRRAFASLGSE